MVDLPADKREAAINAITLPDFFHDVDTEVPTFEDVMMDFDAQFLVNHTRSEEITLREDYVGYVGLQMEQGGGGGGAGFDDHHHHNHPRQNQYE